MYVTPPASKGKASHQNPIDIRDNGAEAISSLPAPRGRFSHAWEYSVGVVPAAPLSYLFSSPSWIYDM